MPFCSKAMSRSGLLKFEAAIHHLYQYAHQQLIHLVRQCNRCIQDTCHTKHTHQLRAAGLASGPLQLVSKMHNHCHQSASSSWHRTSTQDVSQVDVWAAGVCLYVWLWGKLPFQGDSIPDMFTAIRQQPLTFPDSPACHPHLKDLICQASGICHF